MEMMGYMFIGVGIVVAVFSAIQLFKEPEDD